MTKEQILELTNLCLAYLSFDVSTLTDKESYERYLKLVKVIIIHQKLYYDKSQPIIDDLTFDSLYDYALRLEQRVEQIIWKKIENSISTLRWTVQKWFSKAKHIVPLLSLNKCTTEKEMKTFFASMKKENWEWLRYSLEPKFDWLTVELVYKNWELVEASTRWDWMVWDNIYHNVLAINNPSIPRKIECWWVIMQWKEIRIRWEVVMLKSTFKELTEQWEELSNTRNAASWSLKQLDTNITAKRKLTCFAYDITYYWDIVWEWEETITNHVWETFKTQHEVLTSLKKMWFLVHSFHKVLDENEIIDILENKKEESSAFIANDDCDMDWYVIKVNDLKIRDNMWYTWHHPRSAFAYKYQSEIFETKLINIEWQEWRTWILTPVWIVEPININWVVVSRCSLHNLDIIKEKDIHINDIVYIQRSWEVIPYILWVNVEKRWSDVQEIQEPTTCPICWDEVEKNISSWWTTTYKCLNVNCRWKLLYWLEFFVSKEVMNIDWMWISYITNLVNSWLINSIDEIYNLLDDSKSDQYIQFEWMWMKKLKTIQQWLEASKNNELYRILTWLQIPNIWKNNAKILQKSIYDSMSMTDAQWFKAKQLIEWLSDWHHYSWLEWFWTIIVEQIRKYINDERNQKFIYDLENQWVQFNNFWSLQKAWIVRKNIDVRYSITWSFSKTRYDIIDELEALWCIYYDKPTSSCNIMLIWEKAWSKRDKALKLWLKVYDNDEWLQQLIQEIKEWKYNK